MKLKAPGSSASGIHGVPKDFCHEWARLKVCPISWAAVQKRIRWTQAAGFGSPGGAFWMNEVSNMAVPSRWVGALSSNMIPPRLVPISCRAAKNTHADHCAFGAKRDQ